MDRGATQKARPKWNRSSATSSPPPSAGATSRHSAAFDAMNPLCQRASQLKATEEISLPNPSSPDPRGSGRESAPSAIYENSEPAPVGCCGSISGHLQSSRVTSGHLRSLWPPAATHPALQRFRVVSGRQPLSGWRTRRIPRPVTWARGRKRTKADSVTLFGGFSWGRK